MNGNEIDAGLLVEISRRDTNAIEALEILYDRFHADVYDGYRKCGLSVDESQELTHNVFLDIADYQGPRITNVSSWLTGIVRKHGGNARRLSNNKHRLSFDELSRTIEISISPAEPKSILVECLTTYFDRYAARHPEGAQVITWAEKYNLTSQQVAEIIKETPAVARQSYLSARKAATAYLKRCNHSG